MASFTDLAATAQQAQFQRRVAYALNVAAVVAYNEVNTTPGHAARAAYATKVVNGQYNLQAAALATLTHGGVAAECNSTVLPGNSIPDADLQAAVTSVFSALAGA